jgi:hypothetical protein
MVSGQAGVGDRDAQAYAVAIGHEDMTGTLGRMTDRQNGESSAEQGMGGFRHFDLVGSLIRWVLEPGILLLSRSTLWIMLTCGNCSGEGYVTGSCYD